MTCSELPQILWATFSGEVPAIFMREKPPRAARFFSARYFMHGSESEDMLQIRASAGEYCFFCGNVRNDNSGIVRDAMLFSIPESSEVRCCSRFRNCQTEKSGIAVGAMLFSIPESSKRSIP
jgi:hypothetical protein